MKNKNAFTLLELLIAMAIIGVLMGLAVFGVVQVQQNSRDTQRRKALEDISIGIQQFYSKEGLYPDTINFLGVEAKICSASSCADEDSVIVELKNSAVADNKTNTNQTLYGYQLNDDGYSLGFCDEDGKVINSGTSKSDVDLDCGN